MNGTGFALAGGTRRGPGKLLQQSVSGPPKGKPGMPYILILADGARHEVHATLQFEVINGQTLPKGDLDGEPQVLAAAVLEGSTTLEMPSGKRYRIAIDGPRGQFRFRGL